MIINAILYKLKTGCQWRQLPMKSLFGYRKYSWKSVYHHFRKWAKEGFWLQLWQKLLSKHKHLLDLSSIQLDGSHSMAKRGGEQVAYQGRKKGKTTNMLILTDAQGIPVSSSKAIAGNHNDAFELTTHFEFMLADMRKAKLNTEDLFMNADAGFDTEEFRETCYKNNIMGNIAKNKRNGNEEKTCYTIFDEKLYAFRYVIERTNAWIDAYKNLLVRFDTCSKSWEAWNHIAFSIILIRKLYLKEAI